MILRLPGLDKGVVPEFKDIETGEEVVSGMGNGATVISKRRGASVQIWRKGWAWDKARWICGGTGQLKKRDLVQFRG